MNIENIDIDYILSVLNTQLQHCCNCISEHGTAAAKTREQNAYFDGMRYMLMAILDNSDSNLYLDCNEQRYFLTERKGN